MTERAPNLDRALQYDDEHDDEGPRRPPPGLALDPPEDPPLSHPPEIPVERLDPEALKVIARLRHMHHRAYFVGGCVRDLLLGHKPKDFDVATDAHPGEVRAIFRNCRLIGRRFRLAHVYFRGGKIIEVATFRKNPTEVAEDTGADDADLLITRDNVFGTAEEDAVRRDFTVNGLFYDVATGEVIDYVGGRADLEAHRIATIGDPEIRMREDPVRIMRAVRFAARLGFTIAPDTFEATRRSAPELARCAPARVLEEIFKLLRCGGSSRAFQLLRACGALPVILPALGAALEGWDEAGRKGFFAHLAALDRLVRSGAEVSDAVLLGALVMHMGTERPEVAVEGRPHHRGDSGAETFLDTLVSSSRLPRKVAERVRLALHAQRTLKEPARKRRGRGRGPGGQSYFVDALQLLELSVEATGQGREALARWSAQPQARAEGDREERRARRRAPAKESERERGAEADVLDEASEVSVAEIPAESADLAGEVEVGDEDDAETEAEAEVAASGPGGSRADGAAEAGDAPGNRRRRRRRGGRRRRRRGAGAPGGDGAAPAVAGDKGSQA
ncbi:MAG: CCA tRNA nucleotidyltransferase [Anaeromyxobacter sp.]